MDLIKEVIWILIISTVLILIPIQIIVSPSLELDEVVEQIN